jgi:hypothetical protein
MIRPLAAFGIALAALGLQAPPQEPPRFRASTDAVSVDVAVFDGDRVVRNLRPEDFEVRDNGVRQRVKAADFNTLPIDLRLVFDTSGSISEEDLERYLKTMREVAATMEPRDRCEIITFSSRIADAAARQSPPVRIALQRGSVDGTAFFDAALLSLVTTPIHDRRQIVILLTDALDNASFFDEAMLQEAARRTDAVVYTVLPGDPTQARATSESRLHALSLLTGGRLIVTHEAAVASIVIGAIEEFRQSYVVRYDLVGVDASGWHKLDIRVRGHRVRAKLGYFGR